MKISITGVVEYAIALIVFCVLLFFFKFFCRIYLNKAEEHSAHTHIIDTRAHYSSQDEFGRDVENVPITSSNMRAA